MGTNGNGSDTIFERMPPQDIEAEKAVLASMMLDPNCIPDVIGIVRAEDFLRLAHQKIFRAIVKVSQDDAKPDPVAVIAELSRSGDLDDSETSIDYIGELFSEAVTAANAEYYSRLAKRKSLLRELIRHGTEIVRYSYDESDLPEDIIASAHTKLLALSSDTIQDNVQAIGETLGEVFDELHARQEGGAGQRRVQTGFVDFDNLTGGLHRGELIFLAARPSVGKTCLAVNLADRIAHHGGVAVIFSLEQNRFELSERMLCAEASVDSHKVRTGRLESSDLNDLMDAARVIGKRKIFIDDTPARTVFQIGMSARRIQAKHGLSLVVVDYLQLLSSEADDRKQNREAQVAALSRGLKALARSLDTPLLVLAQLNRESEKGTDKRPKLYHLRESGAIEQDADVVMLLSRDPSDDAIVIVDVAKHRNGRTGSLNLTLLKRYLRFENCSRMPGDDPRLPDDGE